MTNPSEPVNALRGRCAFRRRRAFWVDPTEHEVFKLFPRNPPDKGERVLVDGVRHEVVACPVTWDGATWTMKRGVKVRPLDQENTDG